MKINKSKTIDDMTVKDVGDLAEAAVDLVDSSMLMFWRGMCENDTCGDGSPDTSHADSIQRMVDVLNRIGIKQIGYEEFRKNLEELLKS